MLTRLGGKRHAIQAFSVKVRAKRDFGPHPEGPAIARPEREREFPLVPLRDKARCMRLRDVGDGILPMVMSATLTGPDRRPRRRETGNRAISTLSGSLCGRGFSLLYLLSRNGILDEKRLLQYGTLSNSGFIDVFRREIAQATQCLIRNGLRCPGPDRLHEVGIFAAGERVETCG